MDEFFSYGETEIEYLKTKDKKMAQCIEKYGIIKRNVNSDLFSAVIYQIIGQQISSKALSTIWNKTKSALKNITALSIKSATIDELRSFGISTRKIEYIKAFSDKVLSGEFDLSSVNNLSDEEVISTLSSLKGVGVWTAEMLLIFCLRRPNVFSFGDLAIKRGLCILYGHKQIDKNLFEKYRRRFSPYCSIASFYLWAVSSDLCIK